MPFANTRKKNPCLLQSSWKSREHTLEMGLMKRAMDRKMNRSRRMTGRTPGRCTLIATSSPVSRSTALYTWRANNRWRTTPAKPHRQAHSLAEPPSYQHPSYEEDAHGLQDISLHLQWAIV